jgi:predicted nucleic acid-binding protein
MIFVDTAFLVATLDPRDGLHATARAWASRTRGPFLTPEHVLWETMNFASGTPNRVKSHVLVRHILESPDFEVVPARGDLFEAGLQLHAQRPDKAWSLTDCISFVVMTDRGLAEALTGDHHFNQAGFRALLRVPLS